MDELENLSSDELRAIAGLPTRSPSASPTPSLNVSPQAADPMESMSSAELFKIAGIQPKKPMSDAERGVAMGTNILSGLTFGLGDEIVAAGAAPIEAWKTGKSLGQAYHDKNAQINQIRDDYSDQHPVRSIGSGIFGAIKNPVQFFKGGSGLIGGATKGAGEGLIQGAAYGFGEGEGGLEDRLESAKSGAKWGMGFGGVLGGAGGLLSKSAKSAPKVADKLQENALGARPSDYVRSLKNKGGRAIGEDVDISVRTALRNAIDRGTFKEAADETGNYLANRKAIQNISEEVGQIISVADDARVGPIKIDFKKAKEYISKAPVDDRKALMSTLEEFDNALKEAGEDTLQGMQRNKVALYDKTYTDAGKPREVLDRFIAQDLKKAIETNAPQNLGVNIGKLNKKLGEHLEINRLLERAAGRAEGMSVAQSAAQKIRTSGGYMAPVIAGGAAAGLPGAAAGIAAAKGIQYINTPAGATVAANGLRAAAPALDKAGQALIKGAQSSIPGFAGQLVGETPSSSSQSQIIPSPSPSLGEDMLGGNNFGKQTPQPLERQRQVVPPAFQDDSQGLNPQGQPETQMLDIGLDSKQIEKSSPQAPIVKLAKSRSTSISQKVAKQPKILQALIDVESGGDHRAVSRAGAQGLAQIMPAMQKSLGVKDPFDADQNIAGAKKLLIEELKRFNNTPLALAAYNAGSPRVRAAIKKAGTTRWPMVARHLPKETRSYVGKVLNRLNGKN